MQSYLILFDLTPKPRVAWSRTLTSGGGAALGWTDLNNDGTREVLLARTAGQLQIEIIDARTLQAVRHRDFAGAYFPPVLVDLDWDTHPEVVAASGTHDELVLVDDNLGSVRRLKPPFPLTRGSVWPDVDGDGVQELAFQIPGKGFALLDPELHVKAVFPRGSITGIQDRGPGLRPRIFIEAEGQALDATLQSNPWFLPIRYGPPGLAIALCIGGVFVITYAQRFRSRYRLMYAVGVESLEAKGRGLMVLDGRGSIRWRGPGLAWTSDRTERDVSSLSGLSAHEPELVAWCRQNMRVRPPRTRTGSISLRQTAGAEHADVSMTPVVIGSTHDPHWIVRIAGSGHASQEAWPMMAQRITHAVKNPLTHMLLTVQRLQAEYRERAPAVASRLDPYSERIQDGIGQLRRLTTSFLKLVDLAEPELEETDLASLVTDFGERFRAHLPPDIRLRVETAGEAPTARVDREQIEVALDNLVTNAVDALEAGGTITLTVALAPGVRLDGDSSARDYVQIEVMDVGKGIPTEARERLFEPGYSTSEDGSGLGLAIVKKIVTDHEGRISLDSDVGVGTVFTLLIPQTGPGQQREEGV
jgi:nitrogen-specific signal transduction histidine kinase